MKRVLPILFLLLLPLTLFADGMVFRPTAIPTQVTIPDQRALIHFTNGIERLVIETRFTGAGTNFAWVVPLPSQPVVEPASTGVFPTLQYLFQPRVTHNVPRYYLGILGGFGLLILMRMASRAGWDALVVLMLLLLLAFLLLPALSGAKSRGGSATAPSPDVSILDRQLVGVFETTTLAASDPQALQTWLRENNFAVPTNAEPVIAGYIRSGWVFVAAKVRRDPICGTASFVLSMG